MSTKKEQTRVLPSHLQVRAARQLLEWTQEDLATAAGIGRATIERFEKGGWAIQQATLVKIADACARHGIVFTNGNNPTVSLQPGRATLPHP